MIVGSKEFYNIMDQFEKDMPVHIYGHKFDRAPLSKGNGYINGQFYNDGYINNLFKAYQSGYSLKRCIDIQENIK